MISRKSIVIRGLYYASWSGVIFKICNILLVDLIHNSIVLNLEYICGLYYATFFLSELVTLKIR